MEKNEELKNNIVYDAYYLIKLFNENKIKITQLQIQKLMYLFEGYYLNVKESITSLYDCDYQAWNFGPVAIPLYKEFKKYGRDNIELSDAQKKIADSIEIEKKDRLNKIFEVFKNFSAMDLVNFTHVDGSPWKKAWDKKEYSIIDKVELKNWFSKYVQK